MTSLRMWLVWVVVIAVAAAARAQDTRDYPQWRGQARDGSASGFVEPATWPHALKQRWKVEVGEGYATPLVIGDVVYAFTRRDGQEVVTALDAATGNERWHSGYAAAYTPSQPTRVHGPGPKATPLFLDGKLFTQGISGIVSAFDAATGKRMWQTREPAEHPFYSAASSPAGERGLMLVHPGNYEALTAYDVNDGGVKWTSGDGGFFMSPLIATFEGTRQVVTVTQGGVIGVSMPDGRLLWRYPWGGGGNGGSMPVLHGQTIIVSAGVGVVAIRPAYRGSTWVADTVWETKDVATYLSNPVVIGDAVFGFSTRNSGQFYAIDARDGTLLWLGPPREATNSAVVKAGNVLFFLNDDGELIVAKGSPRQLSGHRALHRVRDVDVGPARDLWQPNLYQGHHYARALDFRLIESLETRRRTPSNPTPTIQRPSGQLGRWELEVGCSLIFSLKPGRVTST